MKYYLYIIRGVSGRAGFGIATDPKDRNKKYASHSGEIVVFPYLYGGLRAHAKALERTIKEQYVDNLFVIGDWETEWLKSEISVEELKSYVDQLILERHYRLELVATDFDFRSENTI